MFKTPHMRPKFPTTSIKLTASIFILVVNDVGPVLWFHRPNYMGK